MSAPSKEPSGFAHVRTIVTDAIAARVTPGAQLSVRWRARDGRWIHWDECFGALGYEPPWAGAKVTLDTPYDLASVTKAMVALAAVRLASRKALDLNTALGRLVREAEGHDAERASLESLAAHRAELPAWLPFYKSVTPETAERGGTRATIVSEAAQVSLEPSGGQARYSDVGYILLGEAMARAAKKPLDAIVRDEVATPLGLESVLQYRSVRPADRDEHVAPTENCPWRGRVVQGNVHDENAYALEGISGHAGLFGTARAVADVGEASLRAVEGERAWFDPTWMRRMIERRSGGTHRLGWDGKSEEGSSAGENMSSATFGHLGFTGTSIWCDPVARVVVALNTNRIHPSRENAGIKPLRIAVHDAVMDALGY